VNGNDDGVRQFEEGGLDFGAFVVQRSLEVFFGERKSPQLSRFGGEAYQMADMSRTLHVLPAALRAASGTIAGHAARWLHHLEAWPTQQNCREWQLSRCGPRCRPSLFQSDQSRPLPRLEEMRMGADPCRIVHPGDNCAGRLSGHVRAGNRRWTCKDANNNGGAMTPKSEGKLT
jgi:hypothetical protein